MGDYLTTREAFQGLILPDSRWQPWTAETTATSAGGRPSITSSSALQLATVDVDRGAPGQTLTLECERSGVPAPPDGHQAAGYLVTHSSDSTELGLDEPLQFTGVSAPIFSGATGTQISMATTSRERLWLAYFDGTYVKASYLDQQRTSFSSPVTLSKALSSVGTVATAACAYGDGGVLVYWVEQPTGSGVDGAIRVNAARIFPDSSSTSVDVLGGTLRRETGTADESGEIDQVESICVAARGDEVLLIAAVEYGTQSGSTYRADYRTTLRQYASSDGGMSFRLIGDLEAANSGFATVPVVFATDAGFCVVYHGWDGSNGRAYARSIGSAYAPLSSAAVVALPTALAGVSHDATFNTIASEERLTGWQDHRGRLFITGDGNHQLYSRSAGASWLEPVTNVSTHKWAYQNSADTLHGWAAAFHKGQAVVAVDRATRGASTDESITLLTLGGWTDQTWPEHPDGDPDQRRPTWDQVYVPCGGVQRVSNVTLTATSMNQTLTAGVQRLTSTATNGTSEAQIATGGTSTRGIAFEGSATTSAGRATNPQKIDPVTFQVLACDLPFTTSAYGVRVNVESGTLRLYELTAADPSLSGSWTLRETVTTTSGARITVRILVQDGRCRAYFYEDDSTRLGRAHRKWTTINSSWNSLTDVGTTVILASKCSQLSKMDSGDSADVHYWAARTQAWNSFGLNLTQIITASTDYTLRPAEYSYRPLWLDTDVLLRALGGTVIDGDQHTIAAAYDSGPAESLTDDPRAGFLEASGATGDLVLAYRLEDETDQLYYGGVLALAFVGVNFATVSVEVYAGGVWQNVKAPAGPISMNVGQSSLTWERAGKQVKATAVGAVPLMVREGEFNGARWRCGEAEGAQIEHTLGGQWEDPDNFPELHLAETVTGTSGSSGGIIPSTSVLLIRRDTLAFQGLRITVSNLRRAEAGGQFKLNRLVIGRFLPHFQPYSWGRVVSLQMGAGATELRDRSSSRVVDAQPRRVVDVAWADGIDTRPASEDSDTPDVVDVFAAENVGQAAKGATAWEVYGTLQRFNGDQPVVYLPRVEYGDAGTYGSQYKILNRRDQIVYGRLEGDARLETIVGDEYTGEVLRGLGFTIRELI